MANFKLILLLCTFLFLPSCDFLKQAQLPRQDFQCDIPKPSNNLQGAAQKQKSDSVNLELIIDATPSMQGFVGNARQSQYERTLNFLLQTADAGWAQGRSQIKYYRFGTAREEIQRGQYIDAQKREFYSGGGIFTDGLLKAAIPKAEEKQISIIVTDLYQTNNDITETVRLLKETYLKQNYAIGVLGIKSEFDGTVYDIGVAKAQRAYSTQGRRDELLRPFYVIILGTHANVEYFFNQLKNKGQGVINEQFFTIFSLNFLEQPATFSLDKHPATFPKNKQLLRNAPTLSNGRIKSRLVDKDRITSFRMSNQSNTPNPGDLNAQIRYRIPFSLLPYTLPIDDSQPNAFTPKQKLGVFERSTSSTSFTEVNAQPLSLGNWKLEADKKLLNFTAQADPNALKSGIYQLTINLVPTVLRDPEWWNKWNFDEGNFDRVKETNFEGSKTLNLLLFLQALKSSTTELIGSSQTQSARLCFAIQKDE